MPSLSELKRNKQMSKALVTGITIWLLSLTVAVIPSLAHGEAVLTVSPAVAVADGSIMVSMEGVESGEIFTVMLVGLNFEATLGSIAVPDGEESASQEFTLPSDVSAGVYQIQAVSEEGESLSAELSIEAGLDDSTSTVNEVAAPSDELLQLDRSKSPLELALIVSGIVISAALGLWLVITPRRS
jgi:hypothetical protein